MKTEDLKAKGLTDEQIQFVMAESGKDVEKVKTEVETAKAELKSTKEQLTEANKTIESYKGKNVEDIEKTANEYKAKYEQSEKEKAEAVEKLKLEHAIDNALTGAGAKNLKAVKATMDLSGVKQDGEKLLHFEDLVKKSKEENPYLYEDKQQGTGSTGNFGKQGKEDKTESLGQRLAREQNEANKVVTENPYFK